MRLSGRGGAVVVLALASLLAACSGDADEPPSASPSGGASGSSSSSESGTGGPGGSASPTGSGATTPSPQEYADEALEILGGGYYASGPEWEAARERVLEEAAQASDVASLYPVLAEATAAAGGKHSFFRTPDEVRSSAEQSTADFEAPEVTVAEGVATITVPEVGDVSQELLQEYADSAATGIAAAAPEVCGWIVDTRGNRGGNMYPMVAGLSPLLPDGPAMSFEGPTGGFSVTFTEGAVGTGGFPAMGVETDLTITDQPIAVLQDGETASSGEAVLTVFRGLENVASFGTESAGYTSANSVMPLDDGAQIVLTGAVYVDRTGVNLDEQPIQPDHLVSATEAADEARAWLAGQGCS